MTEDDIAKLCQDMTADDLDYMIQIYMDGLTEGDEKNTAIGRLIFGILSYGPLDPTNAMGTLEKVRYAWWEYYMYKRKLFYGDKEE
jgi:hypothetical protein